MMSLFHSLSFANPLILWALLSLPIIWWLLRASPPRPQRVKFPPLRLLLQIVSRENQPDKTPWWLLLLRLCLVSLVIIAAARPYLSEANRNAASTTPLLLILDDDWASARDWPQRQALAQKILQEAQDNAVPVTLARTAPSLKEDDLVATDAQTIIQKLATLNPAPLSADRASLLKKLTTSFSTSPSLHIIWLSNGLSQSDADEFAAGLKQLAYGTATLAIALPEPSRLPTSFKAISRQGSNLHLTLQRSLTTPEQTATVIASARDGRELANLSAHFTPDQKQAEITLDLPLELQNQIQKFTIADMHNTAAALLLDDRWRQKTISLQSGTDAEQAQPLLSPLYYVSRALGNSATISEPKDLKSLEEQLKNGLSLLIMADIGTMPEAEEKMLKPWLEQGGVLLRFAGPKFANAQDGLVPVPLRKGGRDLGSALSWEKPQHLQPFPETSPFHGLTADSYVTVSRQVLAEPSSELNQHVWANLEDGTPLVTATRQGKGLIILFHTSANADWSNLALSGLFVSMLQRIADLAPPAGALAQAGSATAEAPSAPLSLTQPYKPFLALSGRGEIVPPSPEIKPLSPEQMAKASPTPSTPPGLYLQGQRESAINLLVDEPQMAPITALPAGATRLSYATTPNLDLSPYLFALGLALLLLDSVIALSLSGRLNRFRRTPLMLLFFLVVGSSAVSLTFPQAQAQSLTPAQAAADFHLAYIKTGDATADQTSEEGLKGLSQLLEARTSVKTAAPVAIDIETDDIIFYPLLYWRVTDTAPEPSAATLEKMDNYMKNGGIIFFDLADGSSEFDNASPATLSLRKILSQLNIPPLEQVPANHTLTRSFYLLKKFPGRYADGPLWVEQMVPNADNIRDGVSSIIIGSNDYAAAWATDDQGLPLYATIPANNDEQREMAARSGINIVMYALTGNYKTDQLHSKVLIERLLGKPTDQIDIMDLPPDQLPPETTDPADLFQLLPQEKP